jgi:hypothetical protein
MSIEEITALATILKRQGQDAVEELQILSEMAAINLKRKYRH